MKNGARGCVGHWKKLGCNVMCIDLERLVKRGGLELHYGLDLNAGRFQSFLVLRNNIWTWRFCTSKIIKSRLVLKFSEHDVWE